MWKLIYKQLWNRKRSNVSLLVELLLVFCLVWYIVDFFFVLGYNYSLTSSYNPDRTYRIKIGQFKEGQREYNVEEDDPELLTDNFNRILEHIRNYTGVESVSVSFSSTPGTNSYSGSEYRNKEDTTLIAQAQLFYIDPNTDFFKVFRYTTDGYGVSVNDFDWADPHIILISKVAADLLFPNESAIGKLVEPSYEPEDEYYKIIGVVDNVKRLDAYRPNVAFYLPQRLDKNNIKDAEVSIRINDNIPDPVFEKDFKAAMANNLRIGNFYFKGLVSYNSLLKASNKSNGIEKDIRIRSYLMIFFLLNILLCIMGTFWYRINVRKDEIGLRLAIGSTPKEIRNLFIKEGLALLSIIIIPALLLEYQLVHAELLMNEIGWDPNEGSVIYLTDHAMIRFMITNVLTILLMCGVIILAVWLPAYKASTMEPADSLRYE